MTSARDGEDVQTTERLLAGEPVADAAAPAELVALVATLREAGRQAAPAPSAELARVLREGRSPDVVPFARRRAARPMTRRAVVTVALGTKIALVSAAAAAALTGVATLEPVPDVIREPARDLVDDVVGVLPWVPDAPAEQSPAHETPSREGAPGEPGEDGGPAGEPGPAAPGEEPGRSDEAPGRPATPPGEPGRDDDGDDGPGRSGEAPGNPGSAPGSSQDGRGNQPAPGQGVAPQVPADPPAGPPTDDGVGSARGGAGDSGDTGRAGEGDQAGAARTDASPYPRALVER